MVQLSHPYTATWKKAECWRIDAFELWCWRRLLRVPRTARRSNQSILREINPEYSLEGLMLKLQYFGHLMQRADSFEKALMLGKTEGRRRRRQQRMSWFFTSTSQNIRASVSVLPMNTQGWFPLGLTGLISLQSKGLSRVFSSPNSKTSIQINYFYKYM